MLCALVFDRVKSGFSHQVETELFGRFGAGERSPGEPGRLRDRAPGGPAYRQIRPFADKSVFEFRFPPVMGDNGDNAFHESKGHVMAQVTNVKLVDDLDGSKAVETVTFGVDGVGYQIDLNAKNAKALRKALAEFVAGARTPKSAAAPSASRGSARAKSTGPDAAAVRQWANESGVPVSVRGRVSADVRAQYLAATGR